MAAKEVLIKAHSGSYDHEMKNRRDTTSSRGTKGKKKEESVIEDILSVMYELDIKKIVTKFVALNLLRLPKCDPKDVDPYSNLQYILDLQQRMQKLEDSTGLMQAQINSNKEDIKENNRTLDQHETNYAEHEVALTDHEKLIKAMGSKEFNIITSVSSSSNGGDNTSRRDDSSSSGVISSSDPGSSSSASDSSSNDSGSGGDSSSGDGDNGSGGGDIVSDNNSSRPAIPNPSDVNASTGIPATSSSSESLPYISFAEAVNSNIVVTPSGDVAAANQVQSQVSAVTATGGGASRGWSGQPLGLSVPPPGPHQTGSSNSSSGGNRRDVPPPGPNHRGSVNSSSGGSRRDVPPPGPNHRGIFNSSRDGNRGGSSNRNRNDWTQVSRNGRPIRNNYNGNRHGNGTVLPPYRSGRVIGSGSGTNTSFRGAPIPKRDLFISRIRPEVLELDIKNHIMALGVTDFELQLMSHEDHPYKSFKLTVNVLDKDSLMTPSIWPEGVCIKRFRYPVNRDHYSNY